MLFGKHDVKAIQEFRNPPRHAPAPRIQLDKREGPDGQFRRTPAAARERHGKRPTANLAAKVRQAMRLETKFPNDATREVIFMLGRAVVGQGSPSERRVPGFTMALHTDDT